jgi:hypothetical protein
MKAVYPYNLRLLTIFNQKNKVRLAKFKITNFQVKMVLLAGIFIGLIFLIAVQYLKRKNVIKKI